jgi:hypothetical protein
MMVPLRRGFGVAKKKINFNNPSLKKVLRGLSVLQNECTSFLRKNNNCLSMELDVLITHYNINFFFF